MILRIFERIEGYGFEYERGNLRRLVARAAADRVMEIN